MARSDDGPSHDSQLTVRFPESANYTVRIEDKRGNGGAGHFYRIEFTEKQPQLTAFLSRPDRRSQERQGIPTAARHSLPERQAVLPGRSKLCG